MFSFSYFLEIQKISRGSIFNRCCSEKLLRNPEYTMESANGQYVF